MFDSNKIIIIIIIIIIINIIIGGFAGSLRDQQTGLDPDASGADSAHVSGCTPQLEFDAATSITTNGRIPISESLYPYIRMALGKESFRLMTEMVVRSTMIVMTMSGS